MITQKNNLANPSESKSIPELAAEGKCHNIPLEFIILISLHDTLLTAPLRLYLHSQIQNTDQAAT